MAARERGGSAKSALAGAGLLLVGGCIGLVLGALLDAPRILLRRLQEPVQTVELEPGPEPAPGSSPGVLAEYRALQEADEPEARAPEPEPPSPAPPPVAAPPPEPKPEAAPAAPAAKPRAAESGPRAEDLIEAIAARTVRATPLPDNVPSPRPAAAEPAPARAAAAPAGAVVQVGAFPDPGAADRVVARLRGLGFDSYRSEREGSGTSRYRVRVRPADGGDAQVLAGRLRERGYDVWITRE